MRCEVRERCEGVLTDVRALLVAAERELEGALATGDAVDAVELAEAVEELARMVFRMQVRAAGAVESTSPAVAGADASAPVPFRRGSDLLRTRLRISGAEARRRIRAAEALLPRAVLSGGEAPPLVARASVAMGFGSPERGGVGLGAPVDVEIVGVEGQERGGEASSGVPTLGRESLDVVLGVLDQIARRGAPEVLEQAEVTLVQHAATFDADTLRRIGARLVALVDPDGAEPSDAVTRSRQGVKVGATWRGLTHLDIWADQLQTEVLLTVLDTGTNPRVVDRGGRGPAGRMTDGAGSGGAGSGGAGSDGAGSASAAPADVVVAGTVIAAAGVGVVDPPARAEAPAAEPSDLVDHRTRPQRMLDALVDACHAAMRAGVLPAAGGLPSQVMVTMSLSDLREGAEVAGERRSRRRGPRPPGGASDRDIGHGTAEPADRDIGLGAPERADRDDGLDPAASVPAAMHGTLAHLPHAGPIPAGALRRLACDADVIPVVLGTASEVLDLGRARRLVTPALRRALIARDGGCLFRGCTIPATWTEAHHVVPWARGGPTGLENMVLLCSGHHHAVHTGRWVIERVPARAGHGGSRGAFRLTPPWVAQPAHTRNAFPLGA